MDYGTLATIVMTLAGGAVGALAWLFKLHGEVRVLREKLHGEVELRKALEGRVNGIVRRDWEPQSDALRATFISQPLARLVAHIAAPCA